MVDDDVLYKFRLRLFSLAAELRNVRAACRLLDVHPSTYYRWRPAVLASGLEMLRPRERRPPRDAQPDLASHRDRASWPSPSATPGSARDASAPRLAQERWGGIMVSPNGVWRVLRRHGLQSAHQPPQSSWPAMPRHPSPSEPVPEERHVEVDHPGELVGLDCFHVGRLSGTAGRVWQYTAIDLATSFVWAELHTTPLNPWRRRPRPSPGGWRPTSRATAGSLEGVLTDNGSEFRTHDFGDTVRELGAVQRFIRPG